MIRVDNQFIIDLFDECQHGDKEHREWLRDKFIEYWNDQVSDPTEELSQEYFTINND